MECKSTKQIKTAKRETTGCSTCAGQFTTTVTCLGCGQTKGA